MNEDTSDWMPNAQLTQADTLPQYSLYAVLDTVGRVGMRFISRTRNFRKIPASHHGTC